MMTKAWADLWPAVVPFIRRGGSQAIPSAVQFLIDEDIIDKSQRVAAETAMRRERNAREEKKENSTFFTDK